jgi:hypothetical protein
VQIRCLRLAQGAFLAAVGLRAGKQARHGDGK